MDQNFTRPVATPSRPAKKGMVLWAIIIILVVALLAAVAYVIKDKIKNKLSNSTSSEYQALFLTNGQVYFGKLEVRHDWLTLRDIYYLQVDDELQPASNNSNTTTPPATGSSNDQSKIKLVKLGSELHGPQDVMYISAQNVLFWENMKDDSKVLQSIKQYQTK